MRTNRRTNKITGDQCISYIPLKLYLGRPNNLKLSENSFRLLETIHSKIHPKPSSSPSSPYPNLFQFVDNRTEPHAEFLASSDFKAVPEPVRKYILLGAPVLHANYSGKIGGANINVHFCIYERGDVAKLERWINHIERWLQVALEQPSTGCNREHIRIMIVMTPLEKLIPMDGQMVDETHANTAFTYSCSSQNKIIIYRKEDWFKTLVHETFHCLGLDFSGVGNDGSVNTEVAKMFPGTNASTDYRIYESYCEVWAQIINHLFSISGYVSKSQFRSTFIKQIRKDTVFVMYQMQKYLEVYGLSYSDLILASGKPLYIEDTNVFSYYMLRSGLLWNLDAFLEYCIGESNSKTSGSEGLFVDFGSDSRNKIAKYVELLERTYKESGFLKMANWIHSVFLPIAKRKCDRRTRRQFKMTMMEHVF